jgi:hypothetical protein
MDCSERSALGAVAQMVVGEGSILDAAHRSAVRP